MFKVGEKICYPLYGAGHVKAIAQQDALGKEGLYYTLFFYNDGIKIMVPVDRARQNGLRHVIQLEETDAVFARLREECRDEEPNWNRRYRQNFEKLREGSALMVADVVKRLAVREQERGLAPEEQKMFKTARRCLLGELLMAGCGTEDELEARINECLRL